MVFRRFFQHFLIISGVFKYVSVYAYSKTAKNRGNTSDDMYIKLILARKKRRFPTIDFNNMEQLRVRLLLKVVFSFAIGPVSSRDNRVLKGPLGRSLRSFARTAHSAHSLRSTPLCYARIARLLHSRAC